MKARTWFAMAVMAVILALAIGAGLVQAGPKQAEMASIQASARWFKEYLDRTGDVGAHTSIAFDPGTGTPWISYYDVANTALKVAHYVGSGGNCGPANDWYCETVDNSGSVGTYNSIDVHPNTGPFPLNTRRVGVAYYDATNGALKFAEYSCFQALCSWRIVTVQDAPVYIGAPSYGQYASFKYNENGEPLIAFYLSSPLFDDELNYAYRVTSGGNCGEGSAAGLWQCVTVDSGDRVGQYASLDYTDFAGLYIAYYDGGAGNLKYAYYMGIGGNCGTGNTWYCVTLDGTDGSDMGRFASLHVPANSADKLQFAYYDATHGKLRYAVRADTGGNCGPGNSFRCYDIEAVGGGTNKAVSLAVDGSNVPIIAYKDASSELGPPQLKIAQPAYSLGLLYGNCGPETPFSTWQCTVIDHGGAYQEEADYVSIALNPGGLAMIAYSELDTYAYPNQYDLKIAKQRVATYLPIVKK